MKSAITPPSLHAAPQLRAMQACDLEAIMQIEPTLFTHPWSPRSFNESLNFGHSAWVMTLDGSIMAYAVMLLVLDESQLLNISVANSHQRQGYGRYLLTQLIGISRQNQAKNMFLEVRVSNKKAINLYISLGFCDISIRKGYYPAINGREDALLMGMAL